MALQVQFEMDEITEQEYTEKERDLLDKLDRLERTAGRREGRTMTDIETVSKTVTEFLQRVLGADSVRVVAVNKTADVWDVEAEVFEESSFLKSLGLPSRVQGQEPLPGETQRGPGGRIVRTSGSGGADHLERLGGKDVNMARGNISIYLYCVTDAAAGTGECRATARRIVPGPRRRDCTPWSAGWRQASSSRRVCVATWRTLSWVAVRDDAARENRRGRHAATAA